MAPDMEKSQFKVNPLPSSGFEVDRANRQLQRVELAESVISILIADTWPITVRMGAVQEQVLSSD